MPARVQSPLTAEPLNRFRSFSIPAFPDLSLPHYEHRFGAHAHAVMTSRIASWLQVLATGELDQFILRFRYNPTASALNRRLAIEVHVRAKDTDIGEAVVAAAIPIEPILASPLTDEECAALYVLARGEHAADVNGHPHYRPECWRRGVRARQAMEPFIDELFDTLRDPAFLDIHLRPVAHEDVLAAVTQALFQLEHERQAPYTFETFRERYRAVLEELTGPAYELLVLAGSSRAEVARRLLRAFAVETMGSGAPDLLEVASPEERLKLRTALNGGGFHQPLLRDGWYSEALRVLTRDRYLDHARSLSRLAVLAGAELVGDLLTLPIPREGLLRTFPLETVVRSARPPAPAPRSAEGMIVLGEDLDRRSPISLPIALLNKHAFVAGVTGSGKSTTLLNVLRQLAEQSIPFLVFEPAKNEYRNLAQLHPWLAEELRVYTPGRERLNPLRLNPFEFPGPITLGEHVGALMGAFRAALPLFEPLPAILEQAIWTAYEQRGWAEDDEGDPEREVPTLRDLEPAVEAAIVAAGYDSEVTGNVRGALRTRLRRLTYGSVGRLFDAARSKPSPDALFRSPSILELGALSQEQINLATLFIVTAVREFLRADPRPDPLKLVLVLEEAHNLIPAREATSAEKGGDAGLEAGRYFTGLLAEMRALGLGVVVVDQTPSAVSPFVLKGTGLKLAHRTVAKDDREALAATMLMTNSQQEALGRLRPGEAYVYHEELHRPVRLAGAMLPDLPQPPRDEWFASWLGARCWYRDAVKERVNDLERRIHANLEWLETWESAARALAVVLPEPGGADEDTREKAQEEIGNIVEALEGIEADTRRWEEELATLRVITRRIGEDMVGSCDGIAIAISRVVELRTLCAAVLESRVRWLLATKEVT